MKFIKNDAQLLIDMRQEMAPGQAVISGAVLRYDFDRPWLTL